RGGAHERFFSTPEDPRHEAMRWAFVLAMAAHLWLGDAWHVDWVLGDLFAIVGVTLLLISPGVLGWALCALGCLLPLLFARDHLTQSVLLVFFATTAAVALARPGSARTRFWRGSWQVVTISTYVFATVHKLNRDFVSATDASCGPYGVRKLMAYYDVTLAAPQWLLDASPHLILTTELSIPVLYLLGRRRLARALAIAFHIPLTLTMAPAFAFVMLAGHAAFLTLDELDTLRRTSASAWRVIAAIACALTTASLLAHGQLTEWTMAPKEALLWGLLLTSLTVLAPSLRKPSPDPPNPLTPPGALVVAAAFLFHCVTPYLGLQFQHTGAMLSNLRIDKGCWNSLVFPESMRIRDDYVRIHAAHLAHPGAYPDTEHTLKTQLWTGTQFLQMRRNWCAPHTEPIHIEGTWREERFVLEDLCDAKETLPFVADPSFQVLPNFLRFQKNLERACPQACMH
ncbi:MAG: hypothetical protein AAGI01_14710, partial [Myxococcota bacterium]